MCDAAGDIESSLQSAAQLFRTELPVFFETDELNRFIYKAFTCSAVFNIKSAEKADIFNDIQIFEYRNFLGDDTYALFYIIIIRVDFFSENFYFALVEFQYGEHTVYGCRFTAAVRTEQADDFIFTG